MTITAGEWKFNGRDIVVGQNIGLQRICTLIEHREEYKDEDAANAHLIAAAPDLLVASELAFGELCNINQNQELIDILDAALSKAKQR